MKTTLTFLFGKDTAHRMQLLESKLQAVQCKHQAYFATTRSKLAMNGDTQPATLVEFVQPRWIAGVPTLEIASTLPPEIATECLACLHQVAVLSLPTPASNKLRAKLTAFFAPATLKSKLRAELLSAQ